jgi:colanic acid biosynthesis glycosyl transferase WcaI
MRILICTINFSPELTGVGKYSGEMVEWLVEQGHKVRVVTAPPHYPQWKVHRGYSAGWFSRESRSATMASDGDLEVVRCPLWVPRVPRGWKRVLHLLSFSFSSWPAMLKSVRWKPDLVLLVAPTLFCSPQTLCVARLSGAAAWLHVHDFEIDAAFQLKDFSSSALQRATARLERVLMQSFDRVSAISERMVQRLIAKGVDEPRCILFPNWVDTSFIYPLQETAPLRAELGISDDSVVALYSGSLGKKQGMQLLLDVSRRIPARHKVQFVFCVDGPGREQFAEAANESGNVMVLPLQPISRLNELLNMADIHLLPQLACAADLVMPSKLTGMMASGRPVLATADPGTQVAEILWQKGLVTRPGSPEEFASALVRLAENPDLRRRLGQKARDYAVSHMDQNRLLARVEKQMLQASSIRSVDGPRESASFAPGEMPDAESVFAAKEAGSGK